MKTVLISGANIAGPTLAYWLSRHGFLPTIVELSTAPRLGGQAIDIRGVALDVVAAMGLLDAVRARRTNLKGCSVVDENGAEIWRSEEMTFSGGRFSDNDVEILRDDLAELLLEKVSPGVEIIYGDTITALKDEGDQVAVEFKNGPSRKFDLVVGADGINSVTRRLAFGDDAQFLHHIGHAIAIWTTPNFLDLVDWQVGCGPPGRRYGVYTARQNTELRVGSLFATDITEDFRGDIDAQKRLVADAIGGSGWKAPELLDFMWTAPDFYFGLMAHVRMDHWTRGRVALVGDAGYCPTVFSGQGTSLAMVGAYVLAYELAQSPDDHVAAFRRYEEKLRCYVLQNQALALMDRTSDVSIRQDAVQVAARALELEGL